MTEEQRSALSAILNRRESRLRLRLDSTDDPVVRYQTLRAIYKYAALRAVGGSGSGNWGHAGVPGVKGGSAPGGGVQNRLTGENGEFTSFSKNKKAAATPHKVTEDELGALPKGSKVIGCGMVLEKQDDGEFGSFKCGDTVVNAWDFPDDEDFSVVVPDSANPNWSKKTYTNENLSEMRKANALITDDKSVVDDALRESSGEAWKNCSAEQAARLRMHPMRTGA